MSLFHPRTHGGLDVVIYDETVQDPNGYVVHGRVKIRHDGADRWVPMAWTASGHAFGVSLRKHPMDLVPLEEVFA